MADLTSGGGGSTSASIEAGKAYVKIGADDKELTNALQRAQKRVDTFGKQIGSSFGQAAGSANALGNGLNSLANNADVTGENIRAVTVSIIAALGPWGMLAAGIISVGVALVSMVNSSKEAVDSLKDVVTSLDDVRRKRLELEAADKGKQAQDTINFFENNATPDQLAEYDKLDKTLRNLPEKYQNIDNIRGLQSALYKEQHAMVIRPDRIAALEEAIGRFEPGMSPKAMVVSYADTIVKRLKERDKNLVEALNKIDAKYDDADMKLRDELASLSQGEILSGPIGLVKTVAELYNTLNEEVGRRQREWMDGFIHESSQDRWNKNRGPALLFLGLQASVEGLMQQAQATSMGGYYSSDQTYAGSLGSVAEQQLDVLKSIDAKIKAIAGKPAIYDP